LSDYTQFGNLHDNTKDTEDIIKTDDIARTFHTRLILNTRVFFSSILNFTRFTAIVKIEELQQY
jgi:hypothetical protein